MPCKKGLGQSTDGFKAGADLTHLFGFIKVAKGFALRALSLKDNCPVSVCLYIRKFSDLEKADNFIKFGFDVKNYFWDNKSGLKFKPDIPLSTISGKDNGPYIGLGFVIGY